MKKSLSYLWPLTKKVNSQYSGILEITWSNGKKVLDTKNANYSYGSLHDILKIGIEKSYPNRNSNVLVLGLGGGSILELLRKDFNFSGNITAVEIDPKVIEIAQTEFNIQQYQPLNIVCEDALEFVKNSSNHYETVIVDVFIDTQIPKAFIEISFWKNLAQLLSPNAKIIFNAGINNAHQQAVNILMEEISPLISFQKLEDIHGTNTLLLGENKA